MSDPIPAAVQDAFRADEYTRRGDAFVVETTAFEGRVSVIDRDNEDPDGSEPTRYAVTVRVPTLAGASVDTIGDAVIRDWFETFERRLHDAPSATRVDVDLETVRVDREDGMVDIEFVFDWPEPATAAEIAKTFVEYVEGTYVEGIVPGYEYEAPVTDLLADASQRGDHGTPL